MPSEIKRVRRGNHRIPWGKVLLLVLAVLVVQSLAWCWAAEVRLPGLRVDLGDADAPRQLSGIITVVLLLTVVSLAPAILIMTTCFTRFAVVFSFLRHALGTQGSPPNQVIIGLSLFLTFFVMQPVWQKIHQEAITPYQQREISGDEFLKRGLKPLQDFMLKQTRKQDLGLFVSLSQQEKPLNAESLPVTTIIPAFVISELKTAVSDRFSPVPPLPDPGHGDCQHPSVHGHDDAAPHHDISPVQTDAFCARRRLEPDDRFPGEKLPLGRRSP